MREFFSPGEVEEPYQQGQADRQEDIEKKIGGTELLPDEEQPEKDSQSHVHCQPDQSQE